MSTSSASSEATGQPPTRAFPGYISQRTSASPAPSTQQQQQLPQLPTTPSAGTQTHHSRNRTVSFSRRVDIRGPDGRTTSVPFRVPSRAVTSSSSSSSNSIGMQAGAEGPPNVPPENPPAAAAAAASPSGQEGALANPPANPPANDPANGPPNPPPNPPPNAPPGPPPGPPPSGGGGFGGFGGAPGPNFWVQIPVANMHQPVYAMPAQQQPLLWANPSVVTPTTVAYPGYRSTQQSPFWTNPSHQLTYPPPQPQQQPYPPPQPQQQPPQQYIYASGYAAPVTYAFPPASAPPAAYPANPTYYYM